MSYFGTIRRTMKYWLFVWAWSYVAGSACLSQQTPFDEYIQRPDQNYRWSLVKNSDEPQAKSYVIELVSQAWRSEKDVDRTLWTHWLVVVVPKEVKWDTALLLVSGGSNGDGVPSASSNARAVADTAHAVVAELRMVPNQPLVFHQDGVPRKEDDLIGYCWDQFLKTGDPTWLPRLPMVKSVLRAMDAVQEFLASEAGGRLTIRKFVVAGGSKRGWTTWMAGASQDPRIAGIVPIVIDVVNVQRTMRNHVAAYGFWAEAIGDYVNHGIMQRWQDPRLQELYRIVDPYFYRQRLRMPKLVLNAVGDQFFTPDSSQFYYDELPGPKLLRYVPNGDHSLRDTNAVQSLIAFFELVAQGKPLPQYSWTFEPGGAIRLVTDEPVRSVVMWYGSNPEARDFRVMTIGKAFRSEPLQPEPDGAYVARVSAPEKGWTAFLIEVTFDTPTSVPLIASSAVRIVPDVLPYAGIVPHQAPYERQVREITNR
ncbi:MAG: PhoPQ-activated pathogenicity protein [Pirellulaceae bacterium]|nr:MAG: PhoPQ-activated pathogenicity protein [Pirellulaceae bacterium]